MDKNVIYKRLILLTTLVAFITIILGAYTRLSNAGLGCPDWPGCYGQLMVPDSEQEILAANAAFPQTPVKKEKAWTEMIHRYVAGSLGLLIVAIAVMSWKRRKPPIFLPTLLVVIVMFQAILGMWTVITLLKPLVVVAHLVFGFITLALLFCLNLQVRTDLTHHNLSKHPKIYFYKITAGIGLVILMLQIMLGGWTSSNYAALACTDLPTCQGQWFPNMDFDQAFSLEATNLEAKNLEEKNVGNAPVNYEGGVLNNEARTAIHFSHRLGAVITLLYLLSLAVVLIKHSSNPLLPPLSRSVGLLIIGLVCTQFTLGLSNVYFGLPLLIATSHNAIASLLLLSLVFLNYLLYQN